jgi:hypothetical protein
MLKLVCQCAWCSLLMVESIHEISFVVQELNEQLIFIQPFMKFPVVVALAYLLSSIQKLTVEFCLSYITSI